MFYYFVLSLPAELFSDKSIIAKALQKVGLVASATKIRGYLNVLEILTKILLDFYSTK